jgi:hypothetical protein
MSVNINAGWHTAFASKPAPTGIAVLRKATMAQKCRAAGPNAQEGLEFLHRIFPKVAL